MRESARSLWWHQVAIVGDITPERSGAGGWRAARSLYVMPQRRMTCHLWHTPFLSSAHLLPTTAACNMIMTTNICLTTAFETCDGSKKHERDLHHRPSKQTFDSFEADVTTSRCSSKHSILSGHSTTQNQYLFVAKINVIYRAGFYLDWLQGKIWLSFVLK